MCGICGVCVFDQAGVDSGVVLQMSGALAHRGPDDEGYYVDPDGTTALGHRRLSIIDLETGHQPILNGDGTTVIVFNGEIYNYQALRERLTQKGYRFQTRTDTEAIVHLYDDMGSACVHHLRGMFAFALWDRKKRELLLARDRIGKKPLYYAVVNQRIYFASEIQALYGVPDLRREVDYAALDLYLTYGYIPSPHTIYTGIRKLPPAHCLRFNETGLSIVRYWAPDLRRKRAVEYDQAKDELMKILVDSVSMRLISDVPLGAFLSGGADSSTVVALMSRLSSRPVKTFSIGFSGKAHNELSYARTVARHYHTDHHEFIVEPQALDVLPEIVRHFGEPYGDSSALPTWYLSKETRRHVTVALNGDGGDELFGGYPWYRMSHLFNRGAAWLPSGLSRALRVAAGPFLPRRIRTAFDLLSQREVERFTYLRSALHAHDRNLLYHDGFKDGLRHDAEDYIARYYDESLEQDYDRALGADLQTYLPEDLLVKVDRVSMAHGLECRSPLLDQELVEYACSLPPEWKIRGRSTKVIFKDTVSGLFPPGFLERPKMGFAAPIADWFRGELQRYLTDTLLNGPLNRMRLLNRDYVKVLLDQHVRGVRDREVLLWHLLMLSLWFEEYGSV